MPPLAPDPSPSGPGETITIRVALPSDIPALVGLLTVLFSQEADFMPDPEAQFRGLARIVGHPEIGEILVMALDGRNGESVRVAGMVNLLYTVSTALGARVAVLEDMVIAPEWRGARLGSRLLREAIAHARSRGCHRITLLTDRDNEAGQRFYRRHGFGPSAMIPLRLSLDPSPSDTSPTEKLSKTLPEGMS